MAKQKHYTKEQVKDVLERNGMSFTKAAKEMGFTPQRAKQLAKHVGLAIEKTLIDVEPLAKRPLVITEGKIKKGGTNGPPTTPAPPPPKAMKR